MSKFIDQIMQDLKQHPLHYKDNKGHGVTKDEVTISQYGNTALLSVIKVEINGQTIPTTYWDCFHLERAVGRWYRSVSLMVFKTSNT